MNRFTESITVSCMEKDFPRQDLGQTTSLSSLFLTEVSSGCTTSGGTVYYTRLCASGVIENKLSPSVPRERE